MLPEQMPISRELKMPAASGIFFCDAKPAWLPVYL